MAKKVLKVLGKDIWFHIFSIVSILLIVTGFLLPPTGIIDGSVFIGVGELFGFGALREVHFAIEKGLDAKVQHNNTSITIGDLNKDEDTDTEEVEES